MQKVDPSQKSLAQKLPPITGPFSQVSYGQILQIFSNLPSAKDVASLGATCIAMNGVSKNDQIWGPLFHRHFPHAEASNGSVDLYKEHSILRHHVKTGIYHRFPLQGDHMEDRGVRCSIQVEGDCIFRRSIKSNEIEIYDKATGKLLQTLKGHTQPITCLQVAGKFIATGSRDKTIIIWNRETGDCLHTLEGHADGIRPHCLVIDGDRIYSGSYDQTTMLSTIKIWNKNTGECLQSIEDLAGEIGFLQIIGDRLIGSLSGMYNYTNENFDETTINIWDKTTGECPQTLKGHEGPIRCLQADEDLLFSGSQDKTIRIWNIKTGECLHVLKGHTQAISRLRVVKERLITSSEDKTIRIWNIKTGECIQTLGEHRDTVSRLQVDEDRLFSGSPDRTLKIWDQETGKCLQTLTEEREYTTCLKVVGNCLITEYEVWDFGIPCPASYSLELLERNLQILEKLTLNESIEKNEAAEELAKELYPDFQKRLEEYRCQIGAPSPLSKEVILHVQAEVCVEVLIHALYRGDSNGVNQILAHLQFINHEHTDKLYGLLWSECGKPNRAQWGEHAFHGRSGYDAPALDKIEAAKKFLDLLKKP